jgi:GH24 family phage-related lysozyme (muramidase)
MCRQLSPNRAGQKRFAMPSPMSISKEGLALLKEFEGFRPRAIALPDGRWLIGYGHARYARANMVIKEEQADLLLRHDLVPIIGELNTTIFSPLSQSQFDALALFAFNVGLDNFRKSGIAARLNAGEPLAAARRMGAWRTAMIDGAPMLVDALVRRRAGELALFMRTQNVVRPASSSLVVPMPDNDLAAAPFGFSAQETVQPLNQNSKAPFPANAAAEAQQSLVREPTPASTISDQPIVVTPPKPKPPSTLRTRFHDLLRARRSRLRSVDYETSAPSQDASQAGQLVLGLGGMTFLVVGIVGGASLMGAAQAETQSSPLAIAELFGGIAGAAACGIAAVRLMLKGPRPTNSGEQDNS